MEKYDMYRFRAGSLIVMLIGEVQCMVWWSGWVSVGLEAQYAWLPQMGLEPSSSPAQMGLEHAWLILKDTRPPNLPTSPS